LEWIERKPYDEFDFGYVLTVHKAQGSQWDSVVLFDESFAFADGRERWLYTGITRAAKQLTVVM
jgi:exodeoxyribonuclease-5